MKTAKLVVSGIVPVLFLAIDVQAQNVGIGFSSPQSKLSVNGNFAVGANYNTAAPANGALIEGVTGIGTTTPDSANSFLTVASTGQSNITLLPAPASSAPNIRSGIFFGSSYFQCTDSPLTGIKDLTFFNIPTQTNVLTLSANNNVGINTTTPMAPLHVATSANFVLPNGSNVTYFNYNNDNKTGFTVTTFPPGSSQPASAIFASNIWSGSSFVSYNGHITVSDERMKNIIGRSASAKDLETLEKIEVTDYTMKDVVKFGTKLFKKVVAQQVEKVYPTAVTSGGVPGFTFTPDIYAVSESVKMEKPGVYNISLAKAHDLKDGDTVRLITPKNPELNAIAHVVSAKAFTIETKEPLGEKVFVFGKQCTDLKAVDYDALSMLNLSATQELAKKVEALEQENKRLANQEASERAEIANLKAADEKLAAMTAEMEALKKAVTTMQEKESGGVRTAVLEPTTF